LPIDYGTNKRPVTKELNKNKVRSVTKRETLESKTKKYELRRFFTQSQANVFEN